MGLINSNSFVFFIAITSVFISKSFKTYVILINLKLKKLASAGSDLQSRSI